MIINLLCKAFIAVLDILLLDFYLKNIYLDIYKKELKIPFIILYIFIFFSSYFTRNIIFYISLEAIKIFIIFIASLFYKIDKIELIKTFFHFFVLKTISQTCIFWLLSWLFNTKVLLFNNYIATSFTILFYIIANYLLYIFILIYISKISSHFKCFKSITIIILIFFSIIFIFTTPVLFFIPVIARTYIFTVVISIAALICFDRMQTRYETDKHNKEAIIQNMAKEEEFVQELEKQQLEIRKINHNLNHILIILQSHLKQGEYKEALEYIDKNLDIHIKAYQALTHTGMTMIDSTINHQIYQMKEQNIEYNEDITKILHLGSIVPDDLSLVLGLAFDNAREACEKVKDQRKISLKLQSKQTHIIIHITNSIPRGSHPYFHKTSKKDSVAHGYGVKGIKEIAKKYHGDVKYDVKDDCVVLRIMLQK